MVASRASSGELTEADVWDSVSTALDVTSFESASSGTASGVFQAAAARFGLSGNACQPQAGEVPSASPAALNVVVETDHSAWETPASPGAALPSFNEFEVSDAGNGKKRGFAYAASPSGFETLSLPVLSPRPMLQLSPPVSPLLSSVPVAVPHRKKHQRIGQTSPSTAAAKVAAWISDDTDAFVPPHLLSASVPNEWEFGPSGNPFRPGSVLEGVGRKLRGLDAGRFRLAVMRQTGFIEADAPPALAPLSGC